MYFKSIDFECPALAVKTHTIVWLCRENKIAHRYLSFVQKDLYRTFIYENIQSVLILFSDRCAGTLSSGGGSSAGF